MSRKVSKLHTIHSPYFRIIIWNPYLSILSRVFSQVECQSMLSLSYLWRCNCVYSSQKRKSPCWAIPCSSMVEYSYNYTETQRRLILSKDCFRLRMDGGWLEALGISLSCQPQSKHFFLDHQSLWNRNLSSKFMQSSWFGKTSRYLSLWLRSLLGLS